MKLQASGHVFSEHVLRPTHVFSCEFCENLKYTFFVEGKTQQTATSGWTTQKNVSDEAIYKNNKFIFFIGTIL